MKSFILIFIFLANLAYGQESLLYNSDRQLIADTIYTIDENSYNNLHSIEVVLLPNIYNNIKYPEIARENNQEGIVIVKISVNKDDVFEFEIVKSDYELFGKAVKDFFSEISLTKIQQISPERDEINIYIPIVFEISEDYFMEKLKQNNSVSIGTNGIAKGCFIIKE